MDTIKTDMNTVFTSMTSWWGSATPSEPTEAVTTQNSDDKKPADPVSTEKAPTPTEKAETSPASSVEEVKAPEEGSSPDTSTDAQQSTKAELPLSAADIEEMSAKATEVAKEWGSYLLAFGKTAASQATEQVTKTAKQLKDTIDNKTMIGDFNKIQTEFVNENTEKKKKSEAGVPSWVGYNEEEAMKAQILALSSDKRNFMRNPPAGVQFNFDFEASFPVATAMLQDDPNLVKMRFELVPKQVKEDIFWRNYFYRVSLIKQSAQLTSLAQQTGTPEKSNIGEPTTKSGKGKEYSRDVEDFDAGSPTENDFASDAFQENEISEEDIKKEMEQLGMSDKEDNIPEWEQELQAELQEYEVVDDGNDLDDAELEQEILDQLEADSSVKQS